MARNDPDTTRGTTDTTRGTAGRVTTPPGRAGSGTAHRAGPAGRDDVRRPVANSLTIVGTLLVVLGGWSILRTLGVVPDVVADVVSEGWGAALVLGGGWLFWHGRRATGAVVAAIGALNLTFSLVPGPFVAPVLLIGVGIVVVVRAAGGRRWSPDRAGEALVNEVRASWRSGATARSITAVFDDATGVIDAEVGDQGVVECLAVFGDVTVSVPHDVAIELRQTAVFGDVRAPDPPQVPALTTVQVRATAVFGDVRIQRL
jgi:hypothetical protein